MDTQFKDRREAGRKLGARLDSWAGLHPVVIGLTRGGVPVAAEVAARLGADLDALVACRLGSRGDPEVAIGAIAEGGTVWLESGNEHPSDCSWMRGEIKKQETELRRRVALIRPALAPLSVASRVVILVDDGVATGATLSAAVLAVRVRGASSVIVAAPVASRDAASGLAERADAAVFLMVPERFEAVGRFYGEFPEVSDEEMLRCLKVYRRTEPAGALPQA